MIVAIKSVAAQQQAAVPATVKGGAENGQRCRCRSTCFEREIEAAVVRGDFGFVDAAQRRLLPHHGDG